VRSKPNPLLQQAKTDLRFRVVPDAKGSLIVASDGLPLTHLTDTPALKWCVLVPEKDGTATLFEGDGAVVGEFKLGKLSNVMAFEAGDYELER
jgi:predicted regulator of Ras-like GTPase activity (Roadblock/LC7/MglB family)